MHISRSVETTPSASRFELPVRVYYEDTDAAGVVYYANYLRYCERARTEWLREIGFEQQRLQAERGLVFVVRSVAADYLSPAWLDDALMVVSTLDKLGHASITFKQTVTRGGTPLFDAWIVVACVDWNKKKACALPVEVRAQFERFSASVSLSPA